jgi:hypothetical protein
MAFSLASNVTRDWSENITSYWRALERRHPERSAAQSKDPAILPQCKATGFLDFARNVDCVDRRFSFTC